MKIILYTTHCPQCKILENKLQSKNISYEVCEDLDTMLMKGFRSTPNLEVDGEIFDFRNAVQWVNRQEVQA